jgi:hypothetical protein
LNFHYEVITQNRLGKERVRPYASDEQLGPGSVLLLDGRHWLLDEVEDSDGARPPRAHARPARYRLWLRHPDGEEEAGAFRRYRAGAPKVGHTFTTIEEGHPVSWQVVDDRLALDDDGEPYLALVAERDYAEEDGDLPDHELEHALAAREEESLPPGAVATIARAEEAGLAVELVALDSGEEPDWDAATSYTSHLILEEVEDDLLELCGVDPDTDPKETWIDTVRARLLSDLQAFRRDVEEEHREIERWDFRGGLVFASLGTFEDEGNPWTGHGWMCRLLDASSLGAAGFARVRRAELDPDDG